MNLTRLIRFPLLLLFAFLQCVAPLAHAHVNGDHAAQNAHLDSIDAAWSGAHRHVPDAAHVAPEETHSAVVCMPPEYRCSVLTMDQPAVVSRKNPLLLCEHRVLLPVALQRQNLPLSPYQHPCSQAPPSKII